MCCRKSVISIFFTVPLFFSATMFTACTQVEYEVNAEIDPAGAGYISGTGTYYEGEEVTLIAEPEEGYLFDYWAVDGEEASTEDSYKLTLENDIKLTAYFYEDELHNFITKAEAALNKDNWEEAGSYLEKALELPGAEGETILERADETNPAGEEVLTLLKEGKVVTRDQVLADLERLEDEREGIVYQFPPYESLEELRPVKPQVDLLEQEPEELFNWFKGLSGWRNKLRSFPVNKYYEKLVLEEGLDEVQARSRQYLEKPLVLNFGDKWDTGEVVFFWVTVFSPGTLLHDGIFWGQDVEPVDAWADEDKAFINLELKEAFSLAGYDFEAGEQYQLIYDISRKEDGTFRVGNYAIKRLKTEEVLNEASISMF